MDQSDEKLQHRFSLDNWKMYEKNLPLQLKIKLLSSFL